MFAAVDRSESGASVVDQAEILAEKFGDPVHVMKRSEVVKTEEEGISRGEVTDIDELRARAASVAAGAVDENTNWVESNAVGLIGNPADEIVEYATEQDARYIVVSPQRKTQTGKILFGSVSQSVLLNADCPVVSIINH